MTSPIADVLRAQARSLDAVADALDAQAVASEVLDVKQAAEVARCSPRSVRAAVKAGKLAARGEGRHVVIERAEVERWLREMPPRPVRVEQTPDDADEVDALADQLRGAAE